MCPDCGRAKLLFETEKKAETFLKFNMDELNPDGNRTMRVYYCPACCGWHISSHEYKGKNDHTDKLIAAYHKDLLMKKDPTKEGEILFKELEQHKFKNRSQVNAYLRERKDIPGNVKEYARLKYYRLYNITKDSGYGL